MRIATARVFVVALAVVPTACFSKPDRAPFGRDAGHDAGEDAGPSDGGAGLSAPRLIDKAYLHVMGGVAGSPGMSTMGFQVNTDGIADGDLVLFIASIDNGSDTMWPNPIATGFAQLGQRFFGNDGQTYVAAWKRASGEPRTYVGTYGTAGSSGAATIALIAVSGVNPQAPINAYMGGVATGAGSSPTLGVSPGVTTSVADCTLVYASGADWLVTNGGSNTFEAPSGFTSLSTLGDRGDASSWDYTSQQVAYREHVSVGATGPITGSMTSTATATAWTALIAIAPAP